MQAPRTEYARSGDLHIAYQVLGEGPDLLWVPGWISHVEHWWEHPRPAAFIRRLASFSRVILFDKRGTGMSDRHAGVPSLDDRLDDMHAVLDTVGAVRPNLLGISFEGAALASLWAAMHPERIANLILFGATAKMLRDTDYPSGMPQEVFDVVVAGIDQRWNDDAFAIEVMAPSHANDAGLRDWFSKWGRISASPGAAKQLFQGLSRLDLRDALPAIESPTLVLHRAGDPTCAIASGRYVADTIPGARFLPLEGADTAIFCGDVDPILAEIRGFITGTHEAPGSDRMLAAVLFTDIVGSTEVAVRLGDSTWRDVLQEYTTTAQTTVSRFGGRVIKSTGDGTLAVFERPARAVLCALALRADVHRLGIGLRCGLDVGTVERIGDDIGGLTVHVAARVLARSPDLGDILVTAAIANLVDDPTIAFEDRGIHALKGIPDQRHLFSALERAPASPA